MTNPTKDITINGNKYEIAIPKERVTDFPLLATVATSGSYNDLSDKPTIPTVESILGVKESEDYDPNTGTGTAPTGIYARLYALEHPTV